MGEWALPGVGNRRYPPWESGCYQGWVIEGTHHESGWVIEGIYPPWESGRCQGWVIEGHCQGWVIEGTHHEWALPGVGNRGYPP